MPRSRRQRLTAVGLTVSLVVGVTLLMTACTPDRSSDARPTAAPSALPRSARPSPGSVTATAGPPAAGPPSGTIQTAGGVITASGARRVSWADVIDQGRPIPDVSATCRDRWRRSGKDLRLQRPSVEFLCLDAIAGTQYRPQGIAGSATTKHYSIGGRPAADRRIVLVSRYSRAQLPGLLAPNHPGESITQLLVLDMDQQRYNTVELVKHDGRGQLRNLNSHGSGLAWAGQYLYSSSHAKLWMYNADDLLQIAGRFALPAVAGWSASGRGGLSSISIDASTEPAQLQTINYAKKKDHTYINSFDLAETGLLMSHPGGAAKDLALSNRFGESGRVVHSTISQAVAGINFQGVASVQGHLFANSSGFRTRRQQPLVDAAVVMKPGRVLGTIQMPDGNGESVYIDQRRGLYQSLVEGGSQFMFSVPVKRLIEVAQRR